MKKKEQKLIELFIQRCREVGLKVTPQRTAIYEALVRSKDHPTAEQVYSQVREKLRNVSFDTVNRNLRQFVTIGAAFIVEGSEGARRYDGNLVSHSHVKCVRCQRILDVYYEPFRDIQVPSSVESDFHVLRKTVYFEGVCKGCSS